MAEIRWRRDQMAGALVVLLGLAVCVGSVIISNNAPRVDVNGAVIDCHDGNIVGPINGTYYLYGEWYGGGNFVVSGNPDLPKLSVYTSASLENGSWEFQGLLHNNTHPGWAADQEAWPWAPEGAWYSPHAIFSPKRQKFILYWSASQGECCEAQWGVAESNDGIHFKLVTMQGTSGLNSSLDGSSLFVDDDGTGYVAYDAMQALGHPNHIVAIDRLSEDYLGSTGQTVAIMPDSFVEGSMLFKRHGVYYIIYGSCCCACRQGSGAVVLSATNISGPWTRQSHDANCNADAPICAGYAGAPTDRPMGQLIINAQGIAISHLKDKAGQDVYLWNGMRWLSGPNNPPKCPGLCAADTGVCKQSPNYQPAQDFDYWVPLKFDPAGNVKQFSPFVDEFELDLA